jgi:hypothetical protein
MYRLSRSASAISTDKQVSPPQDLQINAQIARVERIETQSRRRISASGKKCISAYFSSFFETLLLICNKDFPAY